MKIRMLAALSGAALLALGGAAFAGTMESTFGNTTTVKNGTTGDTIVYHFKQDGTYSAKATMADGTSSEGTGKWAMSADNSQVCVTPDTAPEGQTPTAQCAQYVDGKNVGDTWNIKNDQGQDLTVTISAGM